MPTDPDLLEDLGRVVWAAARLHAGVRDSLNKHDGQPSDLPFSDTLGGAIAGLKSRAEKADRVDQLGWVQTFGEPARDMRNSVLHAVTYTAEDGVQAIRSSHGPSYSRFLVPDLRAVTLALINAHTTLPR